MKYRYLLFCILFLCFCTIGFAQQVTHSHQLKDFAEYTKRPSVKGYSIAKKDPLKPVGRSSNAYICPCNVGCAPLPVTLLSLDAKRTYLERVLVKWKTTNEIQNKGFVVERSFNNVTQFTEVGYVGSQAGMAKEKKYELPDNNDFEGDTYYRLKQLDIDGGFVYSNTVLVKGFNGVPSLRIYPNPVKDNLFIKIYFPKKGSGQLFIINGMQQVVASKNISFSKGTLNLNIPVGALSKGFYYVKIVTGDGIVLNSKFVK